MDLYWIIMLGVTGFAYLALMAVLFRVISFNQLDEDPEMLEQATLPMFREFADTQDIDLSAAPVKGHRDAPARDANSLRVDALDH